MEHVEYDDYRPKVTAKRSSAGLGLYAAESISPNQLIIEYTGDRLTDEEANQRGGMYLFSVTDDITIDGSDRSNTARYINHACNPNAEAEHEVTEDRIYIRAAAPIAIGEEITINYGEQFVADIIDKVGCKCKDCL